VDLPISWIGGGNQTVTITATASAAIPGTSPLMIDSGVVTCVTTAEGGDFTIPTAMLRQLPAANGAVTIVSNSPIVNFTAPLVAGGALDIANLSAGFQSRFSATWQ
jgi:hypothetical protein